MLYVFLYAALLATRSWDRWFSMLDEVALRAE
jgi:hypothetical protein